MNMYSLRGYLGHEFVALMNILQTEGERDGVGERFEGEGACSGAAFFSDAFHLRRFRTNGGQQ
jgi:hypothetical protein